MLNIYHLYPELLNLYGDRGNVLAFAERCRWRGLKAKVKEVCLGDTLDLQEADFLFMGGGSDREQSIVSRQIASTADQLQKALEEGLVILAVCGGYQMLGRFYLDAGGRKIPGLGILDFHTEAGPDRLIGNVAVQVGDLVVTGFENHGGRTHLGRVSPLGKVLSGHGNNGSDGTEGARYHNLFCTYLHGPLLPRNPWFTDHLISLALKRRGMEKTLKPLDDAWEIQGRDRMLKRLGVPIPTQ